MLKNLNAKIVALMLAFIVWFFVVSSLDQVKSFNYRTDINPLNLDSSLEILNESNLSNVKIYYKTLNNVRFAPLNFDDFTVTLNLSGLKSGEHDVPLSVISKHPDLEILNYYPEKIKVILETKLIKIFSPDFETQGHAASGYTVKDIVNAERVINVEGAESIVKQIDKIKGIIPLFGNETSDFIRKVDLKALTKYGSELSPLSIDPENLKIEVKIGLDEETKTVGIIPSLEKISMQEGFFIKSIRIDPPIATIRGKHDNLALIDNLQTIRLSINQLDKDYQSALDLDLPPDISLLNPPDNKVKISLEVGSLNYQREVQVKVQTKNLSGGYDLEYETPITALFVGSPSTLDKIADNDVSIILDFKNNNSLGQKRFELQKTDFIYPQNLTILDMSPKIWEVTVIRK